MRAYAIGDIHGQMKLLDEAHALIRRDQALYGAAPVIHVGDLEDRGPESAQVISHLLAGRAAGEDWIVLKGNHDRLFTDFLDDPMRPDPSLRAELNWLHYKIGGAKTLASYGIANAADRPIYPVHAEAIEAIPPAHRAFLQGLPTSHQIGDLLFVHAGIRPHVALDRQSEDDLLWIRDAFLQFRESHGPLVIHGHTALPQATYYGNRLNIDSSAAYGGPLSAVVIEGRDVFLLTPQGRVAIPVTPDAPPR